MPWNTALFNSIGEICGLAQFPGFVLGHQLLLLLAAAAVFRAYRLRNKSREGRLGLTGYRAHTHHTQSMTLRQTPARHPAYHIAMSRGHQFFRRTS